MHQSPVERASPACGGRQHGGTAPQLSTFALRESRQAHQESCWLGRCSPHWSLERLACVPAPCGCNEQVRCSSCLVCPVQMARYQKVAMTRCGLSKARGSRRATATSICFLVPSSASNVEDCNCSHNGGTPTESMPPERHLWVMWRTDAGERPLEQMEAI
eukprot:scaffold22589_cov27-Tisochrysis_lutea.AAC.2